MQACTAGIDLHVRADTGPKYGLSLDRTVMALIELMFYVPPDTK